MFCLFFFASLQFLGGTYKIELTPTVRVCNYKFSAPWPVASRDFVIIAGEKITVRAPSSLHLYCGAELLTRIYGYDTCVVSSRVRVG